VLPKLTLALSKSNLHPGQTLTVSATLTPGTAPGPVTAFVVIQTPTGQFFSLTGAGFVPGIAPAASLVPVPFSGPILSAVIPGGLPLGTYTWFTALTAFGLPLVIGDQSDIGQVPFDILP